MDKEKKLDCYISKYGLPTMAESGGSKVSSGYACVIANRNGAKKSPIYIYRNGNLINAEHALFVVKLEDLIIKASHFKLDFEVLVYRIIGIDIPNKKVIITLLESHNNYYQESIYFNAVNACVKKASTVNCIEPIYYYSKNKNEYFENSRLVTN